MYQSTITLAANKTGGSDGLVGVLLKYCVSGMMDLASAVVSSNLAREVCFTAVEGRPYS